MKPMQILFALGALCLSACATAPTPEPTPTPTPSAERSITLSRTRCFGFCPDYSVTVQGDGTVIYQGRNFVRVTGEQRATAAPEDVASLFAMVERANFYALRDEYRANISDIPSFTVTVVDGARRKSVLDYGGESVGMPHAVRELQDAIDRVAGTQRWVPGGGRTPKPE
ncbi:MAG: DUF6438 domain-containing protein [Terricaulis sp.]